jgi:K+-sensing histidine kinase KdpD
MAAEPIRNQMLQLAIQKRTVTVTPALDLMEGTKGFIAIVPIFKNGRYTGAVFGVFKIDTLFTLIFDSILKERYNCAVYDGGTLIYQTEPAAQLLDWKKSPIFVKKVVAVRDHNWELVLWPRNYSDQIGYRGIAILVLGLALSGVLGSLVWLLSSKAEQADLYASMLEVSNTLGSANDLHSVFRAAGDACLRMTGVDRCGIFLWNESQKQFEPAWVSSTREPNVQRFLSLKLKYGDLPIINALVDEKRTVLVPEASKMLSISPALVKEFNIKSILAVPMLSKGNLIGAITLDHNGKKHRFRLRQQALIEGIASQTSVAVENAKLLAETQRQSELISKTKKDLESLLAIVSHDLKNPLLTLEGMTSLLLEECAGQLSENGKHYLSRIQANISHMEGLIKDVQELSRVGRVETEIEKMNVQEIVAEVLRDLQQWPVSSKVKVINQIQAEPLYYNRRALRQIFSNLIGNAIKFSAYQSDAQVVLGSNEHDQEFQFSVKDNGIGIDKQYHQCIFDLFYRLQELKNVEGTGIGLAIVQRILETYGGRIWLDSEKGKGTTFYFAIPKGERLKTSVNLTNGRPVSYPDFPSRKTRDS